MYKYLSVCDWFVVMMPLLCETSVSKNAICPSRSCSIVKVMLGSIEFSMSWKVLMVDFLRIAKIYIINVSFPSLRWRLCKLYSFFLNFFQIKVHYNEANVTSHSTAVDLFV